MSRNTSFSGVPPRGLRRQDGATTFTPRPGRGHRGDPVLDPFSLVGEAARALGVPSRSAYERSLPGSSSSRGGASFGRRPAPTSSQSTHTAASKEQL